MEFGGVPEHEEHLQDHEQRRHEHRLQQIVQQRRRPFLEDLVTVQLRSPSDDLNTDAVDPAFRINLNPCRGCQVPDHHYACRYKPSDAGKVDGEVVEHIDNADEESDVELDIRRKRILKSLRINEFGGHAEEEYA